MDLACLLERVGRKGKPVFAKGDIPLSEKRDHLADISGVRFCPFGRRDAGINLTNSTFQLDFINLEPVGICLDLWERRGKTCPWCCLIQTPGMLFSLCFFACQVVLCAVREMFLTYKSKEAVGMAGRGETLHTEIYVPLSACFRATTGILHRFHVCSPQVLMAFNITDKKQAFK
jgi:hypothetical protein